MRGGQPLCRPGDSEARRSRGHDQPVSGGEGTVTFDLTGMDDDLAAADQGVEDLTACLTGAHHQAQVGVDGVGEPVHGLERQAVLGCCQADRVVQYATPAHGRQLVSVPH